MSHPKEYSGLLRQEAEAAPLWPLRKVAIYATAGVLCFNSIMIVCFPVHRAPDVPVEVIFGLFNYVTNVTVDRVLAVVGYLPTYKFMRGADDYGRLVLQSLAGALMWGTVVAGAVWNVRRL